MQLASLDPQPRSYAQAALIADVDRILFISGQVPETPDGTVPNDFDAQCRLARHNVLTVLKGAGMTERNLVKVTIFLSDRQYREVNARIRHEVLGREKSDWNTSACSGACYPDLKAADRWDAILRCFPGVIPIQRLKATLKELAEE